MTKRSAIMLAAGLAVALLIGVAAISLSFGDPSVAHAGGHRSPVVHHRVQTVTIHKKAPGAATGQPTQIVHLSPPSSAGATSMSSGSGDEETQGDDSGADDGSHGSSGAFGDD
jgi:hypothetical protein